MYPSISRSRASELRNPPTSHKQRGSSLAIAVFIVVIMSLLMTAITRSISSSHDQVMQEVLGTRALLAAESANEITLAQIFPLDAAANTCAAANTFPVTRYFNAFNGLQNCLAITTCNESTPDGATYYLVQSTGICKDRLANDEDDESCNNTDDICVSRTVEIEARTL